MKPGVTPRPVDCPRYLEPPNAPLVGRNSGTQEYGPSPVVPGTLGATGGNCGEVLRGEPQREVSKTIFFAFLFLGIA
jgi:hypothetical protein